MKYIITLLGSLACFLQLAAQDCQAAFSFGPTDITIDFFDESTSAPSDPIVSWDWDFEEGTSNEQNPTFTFSEPNQYEVCLTITTQSGCQSTVCVDIQTCVLTLEVTVGECDGNNEIPITINITDPYDEAQDINVSIDGELVPGSPFRIRDDEPVTINTTLPGDGLTHTVSVSSEDVGTCSNTLDFIVPDCSSDCFLSSMSLMTTGGTTHTIDVGDDFFAPDNLTIVIGDLVEFTWVGDGHSTTSDVTSGPDSWNSGVIGFGSTYEVSIVNPGVHRYYCIPHGGPNGAGMSGVLVANCPDGGQFTVNINFSTSIANPAGYEVLVDGAVVSQNDYNGTGPQSTSITIAGDGQSHTIDVRDVNDPTCIISRNYLAPDCGAAPSCSLQVSAEETGGCDGNDNVPVTLTVSAINPGASGFTVLVNGSSAGSFTYDPSGTTVATVDVPGNGQAQEITVQDNADNTCTGTTSLMTTNCAITCSITNLTAATGSSTTHTVEVIDFDFVPQDITITAGDVVEWIWTGAVGHTSTSDATSGPDSWESGLLNNGATYTSPVLSAGLHPYYCVPHGAPGGVGMAGTVTVQADCTNGNVSVGIDFTAQGGSFNGYEILVDGQVAGTGNYDPSGQNSTSVLVAGDGQNHSITIRDADDPSCAATTTIDTPDCNAPSCSLSVTATETGACDSNDEVPVTLTINDVGGSASGFTVTVDGTNAGTFSYSGTGTTTVTINVNGDGQLHTITVTDVDDTTCTGSTEIETTNCIIPCSITNLVASSGSSTTHTVEVIDFDFVPQDITITAGDVVEWIWTGAVGHTSTSDATSGPDSWESGLLNNGATYTSPVLSAGLHPYYCVPHGAPGGVGMAGTITVQADCTNGNVSVGIDFTAQGGSFNGYEILVDGQVAGTGNYDPSGQNSTSVLVAGDGQNHSITIRDADDPSCAATTTIDTPDCNAPSCSLSVTATETGACDSNDEVPVTLTINDVGGSASGFTVTVDGTNAGTFSYSGTGTTTVTINVMGDGQLHTITVTDVDDTTCTGSTDIETTNCIIPCSITNLVASSGSSTTHTVEVIDFDFVPQDITITTGDVVEWIWTGAVGHTSTSDATSGPDSWESGLLNNGATYTSPVLSAGLHPYYCVPHGAPGGVGMAGTITVQADCTNGNVSVGIDFTAQGGSFNGYEILVDGQVAGTGNYDPSGQNSTSVLVAGDGQNHSITIRDADDPSCAATTTIDTPDCNAPTCSLSVTATETGACDSNDEVPVTLTINDVGGSASGFTVTVDGTNAGTFSYSGTGTTTVTINVNGDGQLHNITVTDVDDTTCTGSTEIETTNCSTPCSLTNLQLAVAGQDGGIVHEVEVRDFEFVPANLTLNLGDTVRYVWTGVIPHTSTSDATSGPDSWESGLLDQGAIFDVIPTTTGEHPYYCIPHGAPGGVGMAGTLIVAPPCEDGMATVAISFEAIGNSGSYQIWVDGQQYPGSPFAYDGTNTTRLIQIPGDGQSHMIQIRDSENASCFVQDVIAVPDCGGISSPCELDLTTNILADCNEEGQVEIGLEVNHTNQGSGFHILLDGASITPDPIPYANGGLTTTSIFLSGTGALRTLTVVDQDSVNCQASSSIQLPDCDVTCLVTDLVVNASTTTHIVEVEDFAFSPTVLEVNVGDTVRFVWMGVVPHTTTSDATSGPDSWDSPLLGQGGTYDVVIQTAGEHPYYCIPHGGPGGIGMAGTIIANLPCNSGQGLVNIEFNVTSGSPLGYQIFVDGVLVAGPLPYDDPQGANATMIEVPGDAQSHILTVQDLEVGFCAASATFIAPDCPEVCLVEGFTVTTGSDIVHTINVEDFVFEPSYLQARAGETIRFVWTGEVPHTTTSDATSGPDSWGSDLLGQGSVYEVVLTETGMHPYYCIPHGGPGGIGMAGVIEVLPGCEDSLASYQLQFSVTNGSSAGYRVFAAGVPLPGNPYPYDDPMGENTLNIEYPSFGQQLVFTVQDMETPFCAATQSILAPDCSPSCEIAAQLSGEWECGDASAMNTLLVVGDNTGSDGFNVIVDGNVQSGSPYAYAGDTTLVQLIVLNDGLPHEVTIVDVELPDCQFTTEVTADCQGECNLIITNINIGGKARHEVLVRDFDYLPLQLEVEVGDTVHFVWVGDVPHTVTSDAIEGPDVWNSGLLGNGAEFEIIIQTAGEHPYYCIPHGAPGGIGMAANITAVEECEDGELNVQVDFQLSYPTGSGYQLLVDNEPVDNGDYLPGGQQQLNLTLPGDGGSYLVSIVDNGDASCRVDTMVQMPDCDDVCFGVAADFNFMLTPTPFTYQFTNQSTGDPDVVRWDFGDGQTSTEFDPEHTFPGTGDYEVCLMIENSSLLCVDTLCQTVSIGANLCEAGFNFEIDGLDVTFADESLTSSPITEWVWSLSNGIQISGDSMPTYTFPNLATYEVCLTVTTEECTSTYCETIDLSDPCLLFQADFTVQTGDGLELLFIDQTTGTPNQWLWGFGDGATSTEQFPDHEYAVDGIYRVCLLVQDTVNNCNSVYCIDQMVGTVGTQEPTVSQELQIFPNPVAKSVLEWQLSGWNAAEMGQEVTIRIYQIDGKPVQAYTTQLVPQLSLQLQQPLPPGIYLVEARSGTQLYLGKVLVQ